MTPLSVLTIVRNRAAHLDQLIEGLRRSRVAPAELIVVDMSDEPIRPGSCPFAIRTIRLETDGLPLARARNLAAEQARSPHLLFLDVDCIPMADCLGRLGSELDATDALLCADIRYLGPGDAAPGWSEVSLLSRGRPHPVREFPPIGVRREPNPGLFWSLAFACRSDRFAALCGFDERFTGYGAEDTDFGFRAAEAGLALLFVGGAIACHQHHQSFDPPLQHFHDIVRNADTFRERWRRWPMEGWLQAFAGFGLIRLEADRIVRLREPTDQELASAELR